MALQIGEEIGPYRIVDRLGSGGMAIVYKAHQPRLDRHVALKVLHAMFMQDENFLSRFEREARIVARLDHPGIVPIYDYDEHNGQPYLVMKFVEGETLKQVLRGSPLASAAILRILMPVASALDYAHGQGILHRDVKPSNILIDERGQAHLTDFGLARLVKAGESTMSAEVMLGTPHYISPEQAQGGIDLGPGTDVYSLGIVLYEMVTGQVPFAGETSYAIIHHHIYMPPPAPRSINPNISPEVERVLLRALAKNPEERYATPGELIEDYRRAVSGEPVQAQPPPRQSAPPPERIPAPAADEGTWGEVERELREAGSEIKRELTKAFHEVDEALDGKLSRLSWRPGAKWTTDAYGNQGFFTQDELDAIEASMSQEERIRRRVKKRMEERVGLMSHLAAYVLVNLVLWFIWVASGAGFPWPLFPTVFWGIGMFAHWSDYYYKYGGGLEKREAMIRREMEREGLGDRYGGKRKRDYDDREVRLSEDGELTDSFVDEIEHRNKRKRR
jgi:serine/threonine protein kinase